MPHVIGVLREAEFSPGRVEDDAAILERTRDALARRGVSLALGDHTQLAGQAPDAIVAMCQSTAALAVLDRFGATITINTPAAIRACHRRETIRRLAGTRVPFPPSRVVATTDPDADVAGGAPCWVKRGDVHAMTSDDVLFAETSTAVRRALADFARRDIATAVVQAHVPGVVVKFYGVADGRFFRCYADGPDVPAPIPLLWEAAEAGARALGLEVFGGDLIVTENGTPVVVDLNDWPSFSRCRDEAADAIAGYIMDRLGEARGRGPEGMHAAEART